MLRVSVVSHEFAPSEGCDICRIKLEPFAVLSLCLEPFMPIRFDAARIIRSDDVNSLGFFWKLYRKLVFSAAAALLLPTL